ncbi:hypothetical protein FACS1894188_12710 [Clostridia bacterium]|nr:hypothetical protein FACS1894188_12710 [Clostridia bacterium]
MSLAQKAGDLEARIDDSVFVGAYKEVADGVNGMTGELVELIDKTRNCLDGFANGDLDAPFPALPGKQARLTQSIESFRKNLFYREVE